MTANQYSQDDPAQVTEASSLDALLVRTMAFEFDDDINPHWHQQKKEWSHMVNGASLAMPYLEPFLMRTLRKSFNKIESKQLLTEVKWYMQQEGQHYKQHRKFNDMLINKGYNELREVEQQMQQEFESLEKNRSHKFCMAYAAGFETMALAIGHWLIDEREFLFAGADSRVASLILWHFVEEIEHKNVAFDAYQAVYGGYFYRVYGVFYSALHVIKHSRRAYQVMLKKDGLWNKARSRWRLMKMILRFFANMIPKLLVSCLPGHHPSDIKDPAWYRQWLAKFQHDPAAVTQLDTRKLGA